MRCVNHETEFKGFLFNLIISMLCGIVVGMTQMIVKNINVGIIEELIMFSIIGGVIGTISRSVFIYLVGIKQKSALLAFVCVFIVIGGISCLPSIYYYLYIKNCFNYRANIYFNNCRVFGDEFLLLFI